MDAWPSLIIGATVCGYWSCVFVKVLRVSRKARKMGRVLIPRQGRERLMWVVWVPLVISWMALPLIVPNQSPERHSLIALPAFVGRYAWFEVIRWVAALGGMAALACSIPCWRYMGKQWRMAVDPQQKADLLVGGPFRLVRHPIYALSMALMICTMVSTPAPIVLVLGVVHLTLIQLKARNEEGFLRGQFGEAYAEYCRHTRRFVPRISRRGAPGTGDGQGMPHVPASNHGN